MRSKKLYVEFIETGICKTDMLQIVALFMTKN